MDTPLIPPQWFVGRWNEHNPGQYRTALDPLLMLAWHTFSRPDPGTFRIISGI